MGWWSGAVWGEVVGVVENARTHQLFSPNPPTIYRIPWAYAYSDLTFVLRTPGDPLALVEDVRARFAELEPLVPLLDVRVLDEYVADQAAPTRFVLALVGVFALVALGLAAIGLYGVISYAVGRRLREFSIRLAIGARPEELSRLVLRAGLSLTAVGVVLGLAVAVALRGAIAPFLFGVHPLDPITLLGIGALLTTVAALACMVPARRATRVDVITVLTEA